MGFGGAKNPCKVNSQFYRHLRLKLCQRFETYRPENWNEDLWADCNVVEDLYPLNSGQTYWPEEATFISLIVSIAFQFSISLNFALFIISFL